MVGPGAQRMTGRYGFSSLQQPPDFLVRIVVRLSSPRTVREQAQRRDLGQRIRGAPEAGEPAHDPQAGGPGVGLVTGILRSPLQGEGGGEASTAFCQKSSKLP